MSRLSSYLRRQRQGDPQALEKRYYDVIARLAPGRSFVDIGCMWMVNGAYAFHAAANNATSVVGFDMNPATPEFTARNAALGNRLQFVQGDINDTRIDELLGRFDVVFCAGVLYHMPNPVLTLEQLRRICDKTLILGTATIPERDCAQSAIFVPQLTPQDMQRLNYRTPRLKRGLDSAFEPDRGYGNWFWLLTPSCVRAMLATAGFEVIETFIYPRATLFVSRPSTNSGRDVSTSAAVEDEQGGSVPG